ncbi:MAG: cytochrome c nitrite reductase small subunit [Deltaproteobacteria bacterium]|jgi:cytochrome c nitrite reductase small subunit|nr:cytochrome c nitrite reductase small subunit [Deltaproteobacteria bacterium]
MVKLPLGFSFANKWLYVGSAVLGLLAGMAIWTMYVSRFPSYLGDEPETCVNCHIMAPWYQSWQASSHRPWTTCNDCHVPQSGAVEKWLFKATDGLYHASVFTFSEPPQVIRPVGGTDRVILENCLRCHSPLVTEFTRMNTNFEDMLSGKAKACWDCHREVPHTRVSNLGSAVSMSAPHPDSPVPDWLKSML